MGQYADLLNRRSVTGHGGALGTYVSDAIGIALQTDELFRVDNGHFV
jgi:hypothetical protein